MRDDLDSVGRKPVEGVDYVIERDYRPSGPPCPVCGSATEMDHKNRQFCPTCIANQYDRYAKPDTSMTMRVPSELIEDLKDIAIRMGVKNYQVMVRDILVDFAQKNRRAS